MGARFGTAGNPTFMRDKGRPADAVKALAGLGLTAYEYEAVRGIRISEQACDEVKREAQRFDVKVSLHAPYYVNLASDDDVVWRASLERIRSSLRAAYRMGASPVVVHVGYYGTNPDHALERIEAAIGLLAKENLGPKLGIETMGRLSQVGTLEEVISLCQRFPSFAEPVIDWGHLEARTQGAMRTTDQVLSVLQTVWDKLGRTALDCLHSHYSKMEFSKSGEVKHHDMSEPAFYPDFDEVARAFVLMRASSPTFIAETSALEQDALKMKDIYGTLERTHSNSMAAGGFGVMSK